MGPFLSDHWGDIASVAGAGISFLGFTLAIILIWKAATAAVAAKQAALSTKNALAKNLTIADLVRASERLEEIKGLHRNSDCPIALDRYYDLRRLLADIRTRHPNLTNPEKGRIQRLVQHFMDIEPDVEAASRGQEPPEVEKLNGPIREAQNMIENTISKLQQSI